MVTVDEEVRPNASMARQHGHVRPWWRRGHTGFLAFLVLLNILFDCFAFRPENELAGDMLWAGILLAQTFLMGLWMAFGGLNAAVRGVAVAAGTTGGILAVSIGGADFAPMGGTRDRMQLRLVDCIHILTAFALLLGYARWFDREYLALAAVGGGLALFNAIPIALLIVTPRPSARFWLLCAALLAASRAVEYVSMVYLIDSAINSQPGLLFPFEFGLVATLLANLLPLRLLFGLHLFSVAKGAAGDLAAELDQGLAEVEAAWPTMPETVRAQIVTLARSAGAAELAQSRSDLGG